MLKSGNRPAMAEADSTPRSLYQEELPSQRYMSKEQCRALADRISAMTEGGGITYVGTQSSWLGNLRWARNQVTTGGDIQDTTTTIGRTVFGAGGRTRTNAVDDDATLRSMVREAERLRLWSPQAPDQYPVPFKGRPLKVNPMSEPKIWFDRTVQLSAEARAQAIEPIVKESIEKDFLSAGYIQVNAFANSVIQNEPDMARYYPFTSAQFSLTVRDKRGTQSGWAGVDFADWGRIDTEKLTRIAIDKCEQSRNPVAIEPGRFTAILEPQAVSDLFEPVITSLNRPPAEEGQGPFASKRQGFSKIGERVMDERITVSADPLDPDLGFVPFDWNGDPYVNVNWVERGVLKELAYSRYYAIAQLQKDWALPNSLAYRISGGSTSIDEMIATTERGVLVTRFHNVNVIDRNSLLCSGVTRDGLWLIERGKISKAIKNFRFTESPLFTLNNVEQLGVPQRVFRPRAPAVCPPIKARDFSFTGLMNAV